MKRLVNVSFPGSGHHLLEGCLKGIFGAELHYCDYYRHCRRFPCIDPQTNLQKNHDFNLRLPLRPEFTYIVQYRHPLPATTSWYLAELRHRHKARIGEARIKQNLKLTFFLDSSLYWQVFLFRSLIYWKRFVRKWALPVHPNVLRLSYPDLLADPVGTLMHIGAAARTTETIRRRDVEEVVRREDISQRRRIETFKYFDAAQFARIDKSLEGTLSALGLARGWEEA